jgi:histidinol-phosphate aminotransferase
MQAALEDAEFLPRYLAQVKDSRQRLYAACRRLGLEYWESSANFVLVRVGDRVGDVMKALQARGIHVRDRSRDPHAPGCVRITTGIVTHTDAAISALEAIFV